MPRDSIGLEGKPALRLERDRWKAKAQRITTLEWQREQSRLALKTMRAALKRIRVCTNCQGCASIAAAAVERANEIHARKKPIDGGPLRNEDLSRTTSTKGEKR